jgi:hypothetical protein
MQLPILALEADREQTEQPSCQGVYRYRSFRSGRGFDDWIRPGRNSLVKVRSILRHVLFNLLTFSFLITLQLQLPDESLAQVKPQQPQGAHFINLIRKTRSVDTSVARDLR